MRFQTLDAWLNWQESLHPSRIDLGLERVGRVAERLGLLTPSHLVVTIAGTNGKGSSVAMLDAILRAAGYRVGAYTSPHLLDYRERIRLAGDPVSELRLCEAFDRIDRGRGDLTLSYFEFGTLAAMLLFQSVDLDVALLEVGLGGRLDAVNVQDPDVALVSSIGLDHQNWLGDTREAIGREKAGIMRAGRPAVCADPRPPASVSEYARTTGVRLLQAGHDFGFELRGTRWDWWTRSGNRHIGLPRPALAGDVQVQNASGVLMVLELLRARLPVDRAALEHGLTHVQLAGRLQRLPGPIETILDVAHNPDGVAVLAHQLRDSPCRGDTIAVMGVLQDKDLPGMLGPLRGLVTRWHVAPVRSSRSRKAEDLAAEIRRMEATGSVTTYPSVADAYASARESARETDRIVVLGSFYTVAEALALPV